jgi:hypothetical protein
MTGVDRLQAAKARPAFIEDAVRTALRDAIAWRIGGGSAPGADALVAAAVASARLDLDASESDSLERSRALAAVQKVAKRFGTSALCRRLMKVPASQFLRLPQTKHGPDVIVRDRRRRLHAIVLTVRRDAFEAGQIAGRVALATPLSVCDRLTPLTVHVFSLATAQRQTFERDVFDGLPTRVDTRVA